METTMSFCSIPQALQFLDELCIEGCLLLLGSLPACDPDEDDVLGAIDTEPGVLDDEVRFGVLLVDLVAVAWRYSEGRKNGPVDPVKKFLDLFLATALVGIDSKKRHCMLLVPGNWRLVWKIGEVLIRSPPLSAGFNSSW
jgi:hypothetical protein